MRLRKKLAMAVLTGAVVSIAALCAATVASASVNSATGGQNCTTASNGVVYCNQQSQIAIQQSDQKTEVLNLTSNGVMQVRWQFPNGWKPKTQKGCHWVTGGTNSYVNGAGQLVKIDWTGKRAYICPSKSSPSGWRKAGGPPHWEPCGNVFWPLSVKQPKNIFRGKYKVVQHFSFTARISLKLTLHGQVSATASCSVTGASASGTATGTDVESIVVNGTATGSTMAQAIGKARQVAIGSKEVNDLKATVTANASYKMQASASASCEAPPPPPPPPPPATCQDKNASNYGGQLPCQYPPQKCTDTKATNYGGPLPCTYPQPPSVTITSMTTLNDVPEGKTSGPFYITVNASATGTMTIDPGNGGISDCNSSTPQGSLTDNLAAGNNNICVIYYAPMDASATQGSITATAIVTTSGGTAKDVKVATFAITHPVRP